MLDDYKIFMEEFNITEERLIEFGIKETIYVDKDIVKEEWKALKSRIFDGSSKVFIRGYGREARGTDLYFSMYSNIFGHNQFIKDPTNMIKRLTGYSRQEKPTSKYKQLRNFQVSHIFGKTKNPFSFTAPWNIVYIPKIMDPFTGHESKGELTDVFQKTFINHFYMYYQEYIEDFNQIMIKYKPFITEYLNENSSIISPKFKEDVLKEFNPIII